MVSIRPVIGSPARPGKLTRTSAPVVTSIIAVSGTSAMTQIVEVSAMRNRVSPASDIMPSTAILSSTTPLRGAMIGMLTVVWPSVAMRSITSPGTPRFSNRCRAPSRNRPSDRTSVRNCARAAAISGE